MAGPGYSAIAPAIDFPFFIQLIFALARGRKFSGEQQHKKTIELCFEGKYLF